MIGRLLDLIGMDKNLLWVTVWYQKRVVKYIKNIQDVCHNCVNLKVVRDDILRITIMVAHEYDHKNYKDNESAIYLGQIVDML